MTENPDRNQIFINKLTEIVLANLSDENFGVNDLARESGMSLYNLNRKLKAVTNKTINQFIRETRLLKALEMLQSEGLTVSEVAYRVGFGSPTYFNTCFREFFGYPPGEVKKGEFKIQEVRPSTHVLPRQTPTRIVNRFLIKAITVILVIVLIAFLINYLFFNSSSTNITDFHHKKSIAVLPFRNLSDSTANQYFIDGLMDEILTNLSKIHELRVISRTSVEQFRGSRKLTADIGKKLNADFIVEGSGQKYGNRLRLWVQLIETSTDHHLWAESYDQKIKETGDIFDIQSKIAKAIASKLKVTITPAEKKIIENPSTMNLTAYDFYQHGRNELEKFWADEKNTKPLKIAEDMFHEALKIDSSFARAYTGLAYVYTGRHYKEYLSENYMDSILVLCDIALSYDNTLSEAYSIKGGYYATKSNPEQAMKEYDKAIEYNPNDWMAYWGKGGLYTSKDEGYIKVIDNFQKAISLNPGPRLPDMLTTLSYPYLSAGFIDEGRKYFQEAFKLDEDSSSYFYTLSEIETLTENYDKATEFVGKAIAIDSNSIGALLVMAENYMYRRRYPDALKYIKKCLKINTPESTWVLSFYNYSIGRVFWKNGYKEQAESYFNKHLENAKRMIELGESTREKLDIDPDIACIYLLRGEKVKTYKILEAFNQKKVMSLYDVEYLKNDPIFDSIRDEPQFLKIISEVESKYQAEHQRVKNWLEEQGKL